MIQGQRMTTVGMRRFFVSPELANGKTYTYTISIPRGDIQQAGGTGKVSEDVRKVDVQAGQFIRVDFTQMPPK
jgi:uncharacterized protein (TIGR03000 family)